MSSAGQRTRPVMAASSRSAALAGRTSTRGWSPRAGRSPIGTTRTTTSARNGARQKQGWACGRANSSGRGTGGARTLNLQISDLTNPPGSSSRRRPWAEKMSLDRTAAVRSKATSARAAGSITCRAILLREDGNKPRQRGTLVLHRGGSTSGRLAARAPIVDVNQCTLSQRPHRVGIGHKASIAAGRKDGYRADTEWEIA